MGKSLTMKGVSGNEFIKMKRKLGHRGITKTKRDIKVKERERERNEPRLLIYSSNKCIFIVYFVPGTVIDLVDLVICEKPLDTSILRETVCEGSVGKCFEKGLVVVLLKECKSLY